MWRRFTPFEMDRPFGIEDDITQGSGERMAFHERQTSRNLFLSYFD
jgi:hypothetical protein